MGKYLKIYLWQAISIICNFGALFVITPYISSNHSLYGIYSIVIAAYLFVSYADFGFLSAGMKYASESFAQNNKKDEIEVIGFAGMVFLTFVLVFSAVILGLSFNPSILVKGITNERELSIARDLLIVLAVFSPVFVLQRVVQIIYGVRLKDYIFQKLLIVANLVKLGSAFFFFSGGKYWIVQYFLFSQLCTLIAVCLGIYFVHKNLDYDLKLLIKSFKFSGRLYRKTKKLAFTSIFLTICWILYYELDPFAIGKLLGAKAVAIYAIGFTLITYFRAIFGILFTPFIARFNHFIGLKDNEGLQKFLLKVLIIFFPITVFPVLAVFLTAKNFIFNWVGPDYAASIPIAQVLVLSYVFSFITYPAGILIMGYERVRALYFTSALQPVIYWTGIMISFSFWGLQSFAYFKFVAFFLESMIYTFLILRFLDMNVLHFLKKVILPALLPIVFIVTSLLLIRDRLSLVHSKIDLLFYIFVNGVVVFIAVCCYYLVSPVFKQFVNQLLGGLMSKLKSMKSSATI